MERIDQRIGFIGAGNMAEAMIGALIRKGLSAPENIVASDINADRLAAVTKMYAVTGAKSNVDAMKQCNIIIFAVKPQNIKGVLAETVDAQIFGDLTEKRLIISIAAGIRIKQFEDIFYQNRAEMEKPQIPIIRVMPNTPALVGAGMSGICANAYADESDIETARLLLSAMGRVMVFEEDKMDAVTAISGSGPAYGFYLLESMIAAGVKLGLTEEDASELARTTLSGALQLIEEKKSSPEELRRKVTSPGGTTEAAISVLDEHNAKHTIISAIVAAAEKSRRLSS